jgi:sigma-B regulation protein RsbU (phosphoserine phosphatase)
MPNSPDQLGVVIADVSGKGISAALLMAFVRPVMRSALDRIADPALALERTNLILATERQTGLFVTAVAAIVDTLTGAVRIASAGHEPPLRLSPERGVTEVEVTSAPLIGAFATLGAANHELELEPGESLVLYTDGVTDAADGSGARFGEERLRETLRGVTAASADEVRAAVVDTVAAFRGQAEPADDLALLVVRRLAA